MDGYSVKDAALLLGVKERRVWELIARGVLSSTQEGPEGVRVFLQPRPSRAAPDPQSREPRIYRADDPEPPPRQNGNGGSHEMSPFRELLTEFRNLTERYGQALLALGEARGEVSALRSRVELLEARMDLRLPSARPASTVAWEIPAYTATEPEPEPEPQAPAIEAEPRAPLDPDAIPAEAAVEEPEVGPIRADSAPEPVIEGAEPAAAEPIDTSPREAPSAARRRRAETRRKKIKGGRSALVGIAEALARAEDPTLAELPGAQEAAEALAALQHEVQASEEAPQQPEPEPDAGEAGDAATAMEAPVPSEVLSEEPLEEPELFATVSMPAVSVPAAGLIADTEDELASDEGESTLSDVVEISFAAADVAAEDEAQPLPEVAEPAVTEAAQAVAEGTHELVAAPGSPYSTDVVEPDWFADGDFTWLEAAQAEAEQAVEPDATTGGEAEAPVAGTEQHHEEAVETHPEAAAADFEPSAGDELRAEEEARAAIQDAFEEPMPPAEAAPFDTGAGMSAPEPMTEEPAAEAIAEAFDQAPMEEPAVAEPARAAEPPSGFEPHSVQPVAEPAADEAAGLEPIAEALPAEEPAKEAVQEAFSESPAETETAPPVAEPAAPPAEDQPRAQSGEEELMWLGDEFEQANLEVATQGWRSAGIATPTVEPPALELSDAELSRLAHDEGWDTSEVEAIRRLLGRPAEGVELTMAPQFRDEPLGGTASAEPSAAAPNPARHSMSAMSDPRWLKGRRGPAATAYRRLRRLFPG
jgi:hypothetical protein